MTVIQCISTTLPLHVLNNLIQINITCKWDIILVMKTKLHHHDNDNNYCVLFCIQNAATDHIILILRAKQCYNTL